MNHLGSFELGTPDAPSQSPAILWVAGALRFRALPNCSEERSSYCRAIRPQVRKSASPEVRQSASPQVRKSGSPPVRKSASPPVRQSELLGSVPIIRRAIFSRPRVRQRKDNCVQFFRTA